MIIAYYPVVIYPRIRFIITIGVSVIFFLTKYTRHFGTFYFVVGTGGTGGT